MQLTVNGKTFEVAIGRDHVSIDGESFPVRVEGEGRTRTVYVNDRPLQVEVSGEHSSTTTVIVEGRTYEVTLEGRPLAAARPPAASAPAAPSRRGGPPVPGAVASPIAGRVVRLLVAVGDQVTRGQVVLVLEAMKMENEILAPKDGTVKLIGATAGARVGEGEVLLVID